MEYAFVNFDFTKLITLREKYPYSELFWSAFSRIRTEYGEIRSISPYSVELQENADQNHCKYRHFLRSSVDFMYFSLNFFLVNKCYRLIQVCKYYWSFVFPEAATGSVLWKKVFWKISQNSLGNTCVRVSFSIKFQSSVS